MRYLALILALVAGPALGATMTCDYNTGAGAWTLAWKQPDPGILAVQPERAKSEGWLVLWKDEEKQVEGVAVARAKRGGQMIWQVIDGTDTDGTPADYLLSVEKGLSFVKMPGEEPQEAECEEGVRWKD